VHEGVRKGVAVFGGKKGHQFFPHLKCGWAASGYTPKQQSTQILLCRRVNQRTLSFKAILGSEQVATDSRGGLLASAAKLSN
jgi:hypothetical protein